ncbi:uridine-cytidine kinase C [Selaginella moellendorffii]|uniref:uridine-cytidine kinase C n=1 Tax=Selaginella moellendorffii TaxID=88036 RepID=UPI000D1CCD3E|nr:uridine-cytidine kinase C [Selaginella moellendorffii]XP_024525219.1 uridine-cytidine kinase C [Selaginella moellendorffii]|eukprot:XP_024525218.1 uridine-cytidine kinase C [Selaginella moellendorffii]
MDSKKMSASHRRKCGLLKHQLRLVRRKDCDRYEVAPIADSLSFEKGFFLFIRACQLLAQNMEGVILVGLAGPSGAGKTVFSEKVGSFMPGIGTISMDNYNDSSRVIDGNYDDPRLTDYDTLLDNLQNLRAGNSVEVPIYDFKISKRVGYRKLDVPSSRIVIVEGIYALSEKLRPLLDLRVSITGGVHFDLVKRVLRDINRSGQEPEDIIHQISETVYPMYKAFIEPDLETAHIKIVNKFNPFSGFQNATYILKSSRSVTEEQIRNVLSNDHTETIEEIYDIYLLPPGEDPETCQSYLRMRNRDGKYSLMFEEWVIDEPFIISPRITFEVSVRLLGGLMALGYEMATILKRISHVFSDEKVTVKLDRLEQFQRKYVQVQGKERSVVSDCGSKLGLDNHYVPCSYIEQIQLEKLNSEMALPEDLKEKLSNDTLLPSPTPSFSWLAETKPGIRTLYSQSWTRNSSNKDIPREPLFMSRKGHNGKKSQHLWIEANGKKEEPEPQSHIVDDQDQVRVSEQMASINERLDEVLSRLVELESKLPAAVTTSVSIQRQNSAFVGSFGSNGPSAFLANGNANGHSSPSVPLLQSSSEAYILEEIKILSRGQRHLANQLDMLSNLMHEKYSSSKKKSAKARFKAALRNMRTSSAGLASAAAAAMGLTTLAAVVVVKFWRRSSL